MYTYSCGVMLLGQMKDDALVEGGRLQELGPEDHVGCTQLCDVPCPRLDQLLLIVELLDAVHDTCQLVVTVDVLWGEECCLKSDYFTPNYILLQAVSKRQKGTLFFTNI